MGNKVCSACARPDEDNAFTITHNNGFLPESDKPVLITKAGLKGK